MTAQYSRALKNRGFLHLRNIVPKPLIDSLAIRAAREMHKVSVEVLPTVDGFYLTQPVSRFDLEILTRFALGLKRSEEYRLVKNCPEIERAISQIFGQGWRFYYRSSSSWARFSLPSRMAGEMPPHQDSVYLGTDKDIFVLWIPLHNCPRELGGLGLIPGTHKQGLNRHRINATSRALSVSNRSRKWKTFDYGAGDVMIFHYNLVHGGSRNVTRESVRTSVDFRIQLLGSL